MRKEMPSMGLLDLKDAHNVFFVINSEYKHKSVYKELHRLPFKYIF